MKILLAIDGSDCSKAAVHRVGGYGWPPDAHVRIITVDPPLGDSLVGAATGLSAYDELVRRQREEANANLVEAVAMLKHLAPNLMVTAELLEGAPKERIIEDARSWGADLIVVGSHGRGTFRSLFLGSVSLAVVVGAPCSVLVARDRRVEASDQMQAFDQLPTAH